MPNVSSASAGHDDDEDDPCENDRNGNGKEYVIYKGPERNAEGDLEGTYVGRTSGDASVTATDMVAARFARHHRPNLQSARAVSGHRTAYYNAIRGAEHRHIQALQDSGRGVDQAKGIRDDHPRKQDYLDCAAREFPDCPICNPQE